MGDNVLKTPVLIEAQSLTDVMGNRRQENVQLILQILSSQIAVTTICEISCTSFTIRYDKLTIKPNTTGSSFEISMIERQLPKIIRSFKINKLSQEWLKAWFLSVTDRSWPFASKFSDADTEKILFDFLTSSDETPTEAHAYFVDI